MTAYGAYVSLATSIVTALWAAYSSLISKGTQSCGCLKSKGEMYISNLLRELKVNFIQQYSPNNAYFIKSNRKMKFDFGIFNDNNQLIFLIEYQGSIHYQYSNSGWNTEQNLIERQKRDEEKRQWCQNHNIYLLEIPYWELDNIQFLIQQELNKRGRYNEYN